MTTSEQQPVEDNNNFLPSTLESRARAFKEYKLRSALFNGLLSKEQTERRNALSKITKLVETWANECYSSEKQYPSDTAGTVSSTTEDGREIFSGVSSPFNNSSSFNSPLFTDGSGSASASSYTASPISIVNTLANEEGVEINISENVGVINQRNTTELQRNGIPDGPYDNFSRRNSADENSTDNVGKSEEGRREYLRLFILGMLRMSIDCPFSDVRYAFNKSLRKLRAMGVPMPVPINPYPSFYIVPEEIITLEWPSEYTNNPITQSTPRSITPSGYSSSSSSSSNSSSYSEETPRIIQQPLTPSTPLCSPSMPVGRQPDDLVRKLIIDTFVSFGRLSHHHRILAYFPSFMEKYQESYDIIVRNTNAPVSLSWRFYIGMMAASQYKCQYVFSKLTDDFLLSGGNNDWLHGLQHTPIKIRNLATLNSILAHQPWRLQASHIGSLVRGSLNPQENWTVSEIVHVILILSTFHSLSSYALGCGIVPEYDSIGGNCEQLLSGITNEESGDSVGILNSGRISSDIAFGLGVTLSDTENTSMESVVRLNPSNPIPIPQVPSSTLVRPADVEVTHTNQLIRRLNQRNKEEGRQVNYGSISSDSSYSFSRNPGFENVDEDTFTDDSDASSPFLFSQEFFSNIDTTSHHHHPTYNPPPTEDFSRFLDPSVKISYADFEVNSSEYNVFKLQDYNWETQGVVTVNTYLPGVGEALDREFAEIRELTDYSLFQSYKSNSNLDLDTKPLRQAIWYYVQRLTGLLKDDYEYRDINTFLNKKIKAFLKKVCCTPEEIRYSDWRAVGFRLREEEKCHVSLIAVEARKQAELVHGLSCVMKWEKGKAMSQ